MAVKIIFVAALIFYGAPEATQPMSFEKLFSAIISAQPFIESNIWFTKHPANSRGYYTLCNSWPLHHPLLAKSHLFSSTRWHLAETLLKALTRFLFIVPYVIEGNPKKESFPAKYTRFLHSRPILVTRTKLRLIMSHDRLRALPSLYKLSDISDPY